MLSLHILVVSWPHLGHTSATLYCLENHGCSKEVGWSLIPSGVGASQLVLLLFLLQMVRSKCGRNPQFQDMYFTLIGRDPDDLDIVDANAQVRSDIRRHDIYSVTSLCMPNHWSMAQSWILQAFTWSSSWRIKTR
jgi:hypothetical protein